MFKFQNGQVVFTGFDDVSKVYISRQMDNKTYGIFNNPSMVIGPKISFFDNFSILKNCNFLCDPKTKYFGEDTADCARHALNYENSSIVDETELMVQIQEFDLSDSRGAGTLYKMEKHGLIATFDESEKDENGEYPDDYDPWITPFEMVCYGIRRHGDDDIKLLTIKEIREFIYGSPDSRPVATHSSNEEQDAATAARRAALAERMRQARGDRAVI